MNQHDDPASIYIDALRRLECPESDIARLDTEAKKVEKLKELVLKKSGRPWNIVGNKFTMDKVNYTIGDSEISWQDSDGTDKTVPIHRGFIIASVDYMIDGSYVVWEDERGDEIRVEIIDNTFTISDMTYAIDGS